MFLVVRMANRVDSAHRKKKKDLEVKRHNYLGSFGPKKAPNPARAFFVPFLELAPSV